MLAVPAVVDASELTELFDRVLVEVEERISKRFDCWCCCWLSVVACFMKPCEFVDDVADELKEINKGSNEQLNRMSGVH